MNLDVYRRILAGESLTFMLAPRALWRLTGPDRVRYLNGQVTNDLTTLTDNHARYAAICTAKGRMEGDLYIGAHGAEFYLDADPALREALGARLEKYLISDDAAFEDISDSWRVSHVFGATLPQGPDTSFAIANSRFGVPGHDLWIASTGSSIIGDSVPANVVETLCLENAIPRWGAELTATTLPPEAGPAMLAAISYTKGCYVGQETIARLKSVGHVNRLLVFLVADSATVPAAGAPLLLDGQVAGTITRAGFSPRLERGIALAYVPYKLSAAGTVLQTDGAILTISAPLNERATP